MDIKESLALLRDQRKSKKKIFEPSPERPKNTVSYRGHKAIGDYAGLSVLDIYWTYKVDWVLPDSVGCRIFFLDAKGIVDFKDVDGDYILKDSEELQFKERR